MSWIKKDFKVKTAQDLSRAFSLAEKHNVKAEVQGSIRVRVQGEEKQVKAVEKEF